MNSKRYKIFLPIIVLFVVVYIVFMIYTDSKNADKSKDSLLFLGNKYIAPIVYEENGEAKGIAVDIVKALEEKTGYNIEVEVLDWTEAQKMVQSGEADALIQINPNPAREGLYDFSDGLLESEFSIFIPSGNTQIRSVEDLNNRSVGVESGGHSYIILQKLDGINLVTFLTNRYKKLSKKLELEVQERTKELYETNDMLMKANLELERISLLDQLTDIYNRRFFDQSIEKAWGISRREGLPLALILIDIDKFKDYNDTYGHLSGDLCLKNIAKEIQDTIKRPGDFVARYGGEEFVVLLSNTSQDGAIIVAEEIRRKVENLKNYCDGLETRVTASLGVAALIPDEGSNPKDLIQAADDALYQAKEAGRNQVVFYSKVA